MNVLMIVFDDLNLSLGCYGNPVVKTPNIDRLASRGVLFERTYCQSPLCTPSRSSMLTGLDPDTTGITTLQGHFREHVPDVVTLPQLFRQNGYFTGRAGKVFHMGVPDSVAMHSSGADDPPSWDVAVNCPGYELNSNGVYRNVTPWERCRAGTGGAIAWLRAQNRDEHQHDYNVATTIIDLMRQHQREPFFLAAGFIRPHVPLVAPERFFAMYDNVEIPLPPSSGDSCPELLKGFFGAGFGVSSDEQREAIRAYYACVSFVDAQVGRLLDALDELNLADRTAVVLTADHGFQLGEHGLWFKKFLYEESARVPLILSVPSTPGHGQRCTGLVELLDVYPTVAEIAGQRLVQPAHGSSLVGALCSPSTGGKPAAFVQTRNGQGDKLIKGRSVIRGQHKLNLWNGGKIATELYDLQRDPHERQNLAADPAHAGIVQELEGLLRRRA